VNTLHKGDDDDHDDDDDDDDDDMLPASPVSTPVWVTPLCF
jgi:hypothetical protein